LHIAVTDCNNYSGSETPEAFEYRKSLPTRKALAVQLLRRGHEEFSVACATGIPPSAITELIEKHNIPIQEQ
jgi:hypothetical protein